MLLLLACTAGEGPTERRARPGTDDTDADTDADTDSEIGRAHV